MTVGADQISLKIYVQNAQVERVGIESSRTTMAAKILEGKSPKEACKLLPLLFSLCRTAQLQAGLAAFEEALGYIPSPAHQTARQILLTCEGISEHLTRILVDWAALAGVESDMATLRDLRTQLSAFNQYLFKDGMTDTIGGPKLSKESTALKETISGLNAQIDQLVFAQTADCFLSLSTASDFADWMASQKTAPMKCLTIWQENGLLEGNWPTPRLLPTLQEALIKKEMDGDHADAFIAQPTFEDTPAETGPFARQLSHHLIKDMVSTHGSGPLSRFAAKLIDLAYMSVELRNLADRLEQEHDLFHTKALHCGVAKVEAVRGQLCHHICLDPETDIIQRYRILAPTEWNFHPDGPLSAALVGTDGTDLNKVEQRARLAVLALDPCVASQIVVKEI